MRPSPILVLLPLLVAACTDKEVVPVLVPAGETLVSVDYIDEDGQRMALPTTTNAAGLRCRNFIDGVVRKGGSTNLIPIAVCGDDVLSVRTEEVDKGLVVQLPTRRGADGRLCVRHVAEVTRDGDDLETRSEDSCFSASTLPDPCGGDTLIDARITHFAHCSDGRVYELGLQPRVTLLPGTSAH